MYIHPTRRVFQKFNDHVHFYLAVGFIPLGAIIFYANVFIGPAKLQETPEGYEPENYEYQQVTSMKTW